MSVALLAHDAGPAADYARGLDGALRAAGHDPRLVDAAAPHLLDSLLTRRRFADGLASVPFSVLALAREQFDVAHAFTPADAIAALHWRRVTHRPVVFTCVEILARDNVANRRLRLWSLQRATEECDAVVAATEDVRDAMSRWLALDAPTLEADAARSYVALYGSLQT